MRLPRRVPWASIAELDQVCSWIYTDEHDQHSKVLAINRLSAWKAITALPHALESTLAILVVVVQDNAQYPCSSLSLRQSYAAAIIRLVNGLVDPLQLGTYARSIASIAKQLGLPAWLVELRHAATHEELPSLSLLREAARQSLSWLLHNYFLPTINPLSAPISNAAPLRPLKPILKQYKECMKMITRDTSLASRHKPEITALMKGIERWIAEAGVAANVSVGDVGWESCQPSENASTDHDFKEKWALDRLCDGLLEKGALVPLSKKKRVWPKDAFLPPSTSLAIWAPLLQYLQLLHSDFALVLCNRICSHLLTDPIESDNDQIALESRSSDPSYDACLARWAAWTIATSAKSSPDCDLRRDVIMTLMQGLGRSLPQVTHNNKSSALELLKLLCEGRTELETALALLLRPASQLSGNGWKPTDVTVMQDRLDALQKMSFDNGASEPDATMSTQPTSADPCTTAAPGWRRVSEGWHPCPIGVYV